MVADLCGTWYLVGFFPVTLQHTATATYTVDAHHITRSSNHNHHQQRQGSAGSAGVQLVVLLVLVLDLRMVVVEVSGTCY